MNLLTVRNLHKHFAGIKALRGVSFTVPAGMVIGIIGPNGSGKSTLLDILSGLITHDKGHIEFRYKTDKRRARTFQSPRLFENMTLQDNLLATLPSQLVVPLLKKFGLWNKRESLARELSFGQKKLLEIARAEALGTKVLFLDEPFTGIFSQAQQKVSALIRHAREQGRSVLLVEHDMHLIRELCDRVIVIDNGHIIAEGIPEQVLTNKKVRATYLGRHD
jgi:branched-chain amino acid transport system ATP-binding protein